MKKLILLIMLSMVLLCSSVSAEIVYDDTKIYETNYAGEYAKAIKSIADSYGVSQKSQYNDKNTKGFTYGKLMDLNGDGTPELYFVYKTDDDKDNYVESMWCYENGKAREFYKDSNVLSSGYKGLVFYTNGNNIYALREVSRIFEKYTFYNGLETYFRDFQLMKYSDGEFRSLVDTYSKELYCQNNELLDLRGFTEDKGYERSSYETAEGKVYTASKYSVSENGKLTKLTKTEIANNDYFEKYVGQKVVSNGTYLTDNGQSFVHYTQYGNYPDKSIEYNYETFFKSLSETSKRISPDVTVTFDGEKLEFDTNPVIYKSRVLVPLRVIFEKMGADVKWDDSQKTATATNGTLDIKVPVNKNAIYINGQEKELDVSAKIVNSRTLVPVRAVTESFDCNVSWDDTTKTVIITSKKEN